MNDQAKPLTRTNVAEAARRRMGRLTPAERKVARALLTAYPVAGLETVAELARRAQVSGPTVVRFAAKLGYDHYAAFQQALKDELVARHSTPVRQIASRPLYRQDPVLTRAHQRFSDALTETLDGLSSHDLAGCVKLLADSRRPVTGVGGRFTRGLAEYLIGHLQQLRPNVAMAGDGPFGKTSRALDMARRDVLVAFDFRRYSKDTVEFARAAHTRGSTVILVTDPWLSPIAELAKFTLPAAVEAVSPFDSLLPAMAIVDMLVAAVIDEIADSAEQRVRQMENLAAVASDSRRTYASNAHQK
jgi:DNA-binding MurR/RpiR family transcriptional regulator